jgi:hypothetical protein
LGARKSAQREKSWEHFTDEFGVFGRVGFGGGDEFGFDGFETGVFGGVEDALGCGELASLLGLAHVVEGVLQLKQISFGKFRK